MVSSRGISEKSPSVCQHTQRQASEGLKFILPRGRLGERGRKKGWLPVQRGWSCEQQLGDTAVSFPGSVQPKCPFCLSTASSTPWHLSLCILSTSSTSSWTLLCWAHAVSSGFCSHWVLALPRLGFPVTLWHFSTWSYTVFCVGIIHPKNRLSSWRYHIFSVSFYTPSVAQDYTCSSCSEILNTLI